MAGERRRAAICVACDGGKSGYESERCCKTLNSEKTLQDPPAECLANHFALPSLMHSINPHFSVKEPPRQCVVLPRGHTASWTGVVGKIIAGGPDHQEIRSIVRRGKRCCFNVPKQWDARCPDIQYAC